MNAQDCRWYNLVQELANGKTILLLEDSYIQCYYYKKKLEKVKGIKPEKSPYSIKVKG